MKYEPLLRVLPVQWRFNFCVFGAWVLDFPENVCKLSYRARRTDYDFPGLDGTDHQ